MQGVAWNVCGGEGRGGEVCKGAWGEGRGGLSGKCGEEHGNSRMGWRNRDLPALSKDSNTQGAGKEG